VAGPMTSSASLEARTASAPIKIGFCRRSCFRRDLWL